MSCALLLLASLFASAPETPDSWRIFPTATAGVSFVSERLDTRYSQQHHVSLMLGVGLASARPGPYVMGGLGIEPLGLLDGRAATYVVPMLRVGYGWEDLQGSGLPQQEIFEPMLRLRLYGVVGVRAASKTRSEMLRLGVGFHSTSMMFMSIFHIPANIELLTEHDGRGVPVVSLRLGWGF